MIKILSKYDKQRSKLLKSPNFKNAYWSVADVIVYPIMYLLATPVFLKYLGAEMYGLWMLINSLIASIGVLNGGLSDATIKFISKYRALEDHSSIIRIFRATYSITLVVFALAVGIVLLTSKWLVSSGMFVITPALRLEAVLAMQIATIAFSLKLLEQIFFAYFKAYERYDIYSKISIVSKAVALTTGVILVLNGFSLSALLLGNVIVLFISILLQSTLVGQKLGYSAFIPYFNKQTVVEVFSFSSWAWIQTIISVFSAHLDRYIVAAAVSVEALAYYSIGLLVATQIHNVFAAGSGFIFPLITKRIEQNIEIKPIYYRMQLIVISTGILCIACLVFVQDIAFTLWLGPESYALAESFITWFLCFEVLLITSIIPYYYLIASGHIKLNTFIMGINTVATALAMVILFKFYGEEGLVWGKIIIIMATSPFLYNVLHRRVLQDFDLFAGIKLMLPSLAMVAFILAPSILFKLMALGICFLLLYIVLVKKLKAAA
ncbi:oligosaccharide flippase family protein [uncultured Pontibacter sp.]|uniref:lipopolysaccharide biosynthesis protein n=1 Tax=uncultured Pontibacter sp. TaxID=453356 RepID=UPI00260B0F09|nr:oligosaccharide flippase family protein [uncultured Pontibacter sp.]